MTEAVPDAAPAALRIREAVRALLVDSHDRVLLVRFEFPAGTRWALPGGGIEPGEGPLDALRRELDEELGLRDADIGPHIWTRLHVIPFVNGLWDGQRDQVHLVRTPAFDPSPSLTPEQLRAEFVFELRWWTLAEVERATAEGTVFAPRALATHLAAVLSGDVPNSPLDIEV